MLYNFNQYNIIHNLVVNSTLQLVIDLKFKIARKKFLLISLFTFYTLNVYI